MSLRLTLRRALPTLVLVLVPGCASGPVPGEDTDRVGVGMSGAVAAEASPGDTLAAERAVEIFDFAWSRIRDSYYDTTFGGRSWDDVGERFRPRAAASRSEAGLRMVIQDMLDGIGESHFALIPREAADALDPSAMEDDEPEGGVPGDLGLDARVVEGRVTVVRVEEGGPAERAGVEPGWVIEAVGAQDFAEALEALDELETPLERTVGEMQLEFGVTGALRGAGSAAELTFLPREGPVRVMDLLRRETPGQIIRMGNLPAMVARLEHERIELLGACVGVIRMSIWLAPLSAAFDRAVNELRSCQGIILDLRGNPGGVGGMVMGAAGHFLGEVIPLGIMRSRGTEMRFVANPRRVDPDGKAVDVFQGPLAILVDGMSVSTSEIFAAGMKGVGRARLFGTRTPGQALPSAMIRLPNGDVLQHAIADFTAPDGTRIEGRGVIPDEEVPLTRALLFEGGDPAQDAALGWIRSQLPSSPRP